MIELVWVKTRISTPAHPSATGIGRVSGLVSCLHATCCVRQSVSSSQKRENTPLSLSATGIGRVSGLVSLVAAKTVSVFNYEDP